MKQNLRFGFYAIFAILMATVFMATNPYRTNSIGAGRYYNYPETSGGQDTLANADTITYDVPFKVTDLNRYEHKVHVYAARLTGTETINIFVQEQMFLNNDDAHWINTDTIALGALGAGGTYNAITTIPLSGTRLRYYVVASGTSSSAIIKWQGVLRRKDGAES